VWLSTQIGRDSPTKGGVINELYPILIAINSLFMETIKDVLEIIYFLSAPVIAFLAFKALGQIKEAKRQVDETKETRIINAKRESYKLAAEKCEYFLTVITPKMDILNDSIKEHKITFYEKSKVKIDKNEIHVFPNFKNEEERKIIFTLIPSLEVFNPLESFSLFFISGLADEKIGYLTIGQSFCFSVKRYLPNIVLLSGGKHFTNTIELYKIWNARLEKEKLEEEKDIIQRKLNENISMTIKGIGTE